MNTYNHYVPAWITRRRPPREAAAAPHPPLENTTPLGPPVVRAICAYTSISKTSEWVEPPRQITVIHVKAADVPAGELQSDVMQIITPKPYLSRGAGNRSARVKKP